LLKLLIVLPEHLLFLLTIDCHKGRRPHRFSTN
jgi:hypothetical protein